MARFLSYLAGGAALALSVAAMAWAALPPGDGPGSRVVTWTGDLFAEVGDWYRSGPASGAPDWDAASLELYDANAERGADLILLYGCGSCHTVPGVVGADGSVGPHLGGLVHQAYIGGVLTNRPGGLVRWLVDPTAHSPDTAMPDLGVTEQDARDMAAYLYTLRGL